MLKKDVYCLAVETKVAPLGQILHPWLTLHIV